MADIQYIKLCTVQTQPNKAFVISKCSRGGFTLAQQVSVENEDGTKSNFFMKNALHINSIEALDGLKQGLEAVLEKAKNGEV